MTLSPDQLEGLAAKPIRLAGEPPSSKHVAAVSLARTHLTAINLRQMLEDPKMRRSLMENCAGRSFLTVKVWSQGLLPLTLAKCLSDLLKCPVFPTAFMAPWSGHPIPYCRGIVLLVPRPDLISKYRATGGHHAIPCVMPLNDMDGWDFFAQNMPSKAEDCQSVEAFVAVKSVAQHLTMAGKVPQDTGCYANIELDFPVPVVVNPDHSGPQGRYVGICTTKGLGLHNDPARPAEEGPSLVDEPFDHGAWLVSIDDWKVNVAERISELSHKPRPEIVDIFFYEATPGSWTGEPYRDAQALHVEQMAAQPHLGISIEAEAWSIYIDEQKAAGTWTGECAVRLADDHEARNAQGDRLLALAECLNDQGHVMTFTTRVDADADGYRAILRFSDVQ